MKKFFIALFALGMTLPLTACEETATPPVTEAEEEAYEEGAPIGDQEDVIGDGEIIDEPGEMEPGEADDTILEEDPIVD
ncbi:hypothetical protein [Rubricoccus marinus]|uniref:Uncharacterized protein n=1 Tax=Rubricoccus marinus TaxID=716817 RepID=A0A259TZD9_9BACT|nr:hypothetical protein [Rubricoccus marinus]OZC02924.1 hypothetical protein BSZ36_08025 [Rubricoccus marinus]